MMKEAIISSLQKSLMSHTHLVNEALSELTALSQKQMILPLMEIVANRSLDLPLRVAALVQLKLSVQNRWRPNPLFKSKGISYLSPSEKDILKQNLVSFFMACCQEPKLNKLLQFIVSAVIRYEYKQWMPTQQLIELMQRTEMNVGNVERVLEFIVGVSGAFEIVGKADSYNSFCYSVLPKFEGCMLENSSPKIVYLLTKIFWRSVNGEFYPYFQQKIQIWMGFLKLVVDAYYPQYHLLQSTSNKSSNEFYYFHSKKWATRAIFKLSLPESKLTPAFKALFLTRYLLRFVESILRCICIPCISKLRYFQLRVLYYSLCQFPDCLNQQRLQLQLKILPQFIKAPKNDYVLVSQQPLQYLRKEHDHCWGFTNIRMAALDLWVKMVGSQYVEESLQWISEKIKGNAREDVQMSISILVKMSSSQNPFVLSAIPSVLQHLIQQLESGQILLRCRILELISAYPTAILSQPLLNQLLASIVIILTSPSNTVLIIKSIQSFNSLLSHHSEALSLAKPCINSILKSLLTLLSSSQYEDIVPSLYQLITNLKPEIGQHLLQLIQYFAVQFLRFSKEYNDVQINDGVYDGRMEDAAVGCISIVNSLLENTNEEQLGIIENCLVSMMEECFTEGGLEYYEDGLDLLSTYIFRRSTLTPQLLFFFPLIVYKIIGIPDSLSYQGLSRVLLRQNQVFDSLKSSSNLQYIQRSVPVLRNYIYKCPDNLFENRDFFNNRVLDLVLELIKRFQIESKIQRMSDCVQLLSLWSLVIYILQNSRQKQAIVQIIKVTYSTPGIQFTSSNEYLRKMGCQLWCICAYRQPQLMMHRLDISTIASEAKGMRLKHQKKRVMVGLSTILGNAYVLEHYRQMNLPLVQLFKIISTLMYDSECQSLSSQQQQLFSERTQSNYVSRFSTVDEGAFFLQAVGNILKRYPELQPQLASIPQIGNTSASRR